VSDSQQALSERAAELREAFDRSFALPLAPSPQTTQTFLVVGAGADCYAMAMDALMAIEKARKIVPIPLRTPGLLGLAGFRGQLAPVFSLAWLLGVAEAEPPRWLAFCKGETLLALALDRLETSVQVSERDVCSARPNGPSERSVRRILRLDGGAISVVDVPSLIAAATKAISACPAGSFSPEPTATAIGARCPPSPLAPG
jgi:chemotaxis signal transduction protein